MTTLWKKDGVSADSEIMSFTIGDDPNLDNRIIRFDILGSIAHVMGLEKIGVLGESDSLELCRVLRLIHGEWEKGDFKLNLDDEDVHTALERELVGRLGEIGKKVHTGRSRNDQVLTALRLFMKAELLNVIDVLLNLTKLACQQGLEHLNDIMPGYTHARRAMPSTVAFWYASFADSWVEAVSAGRALFDRLDASPLGAAAGFGVPLPLDREYTAGLLGFGRVQINAAAVQNSRGRLEAEMLGWLLNASRDIEKMASDLLLYSTAEYNFVRLPEVFCTGSSIMPQKKNADVLELLRASSSVLRSCRDEIENVIAKLPSGYHRDLQLTKAPLFRGIDCAFAMFSILAKILPALEWDVKRQSEMCEKELFATHRAMELVMSGMPFRDAYLKTARELESGETNEWQMDAGKIIKALSHIGAPGNPGFAEAKRRMDSDVKWLEETRLKLDSNWTELLNNPNRIVRARPQI